MSNTEEEGMLCSVMLCFDHFLNSITMCLDVKPFIYDETIGLMSQISTALSNDYNSDSALNHTTNESVVRPYDTSGIPSIPGTSNSQNSLRIVSSSGKKNNLTQK